MTTPEPMTEVEKELVQVWKQIFAEVHDLFGPHFGKEPSDRQILAGLRRLKQEHQDSLKRKASAAKSWSEWGSKITGTE